MNELIKVNYYNEQPTVSGRELHGFLQVGTAYKDWFPRMCEYGFEEGKDFCSFLSESTGGRPATDHQLTVPMAKELCMLQRNERGKQARQYFIAVEEEWNRPRPLITPDWTHRRWPRCTAQKISYAAPERNTSSRWPTLWVWPMMSSSEIRTGTINTAKIPLSHGANSSESAKAQPISFCRSAIFLKAVLQTSRKF